VIDLSVVVPVYRSSETLIPLTSRICSSLEGQGWEFEIVLVDDGSPDDSWNTIHDVQREHPGRVVGVQLMRNYGQHNAIMCGFRHASGRFVVTMDDDLQNPPEEIPRLVSAAQDGDLDLVYGIPETREHAVWRNLGSSLIQGFYRRVFRLSNSLSSFRLIRRELLDSILSYNLNFTFIDGLLAWNTCRIGQITVSHHARHVGRSGYSLPRLLFLALNLFTNFSLMPLQLVSALGSLAATAGFLGALVYLILYLFKNITVPGYASIIISILVMGGAQLLALGILGEYLGRLHLNVNRKPQYTIRRVIESGNQARLDEQTESLLSTRFE
jgi:glycosyltransferase involved in cell wall biosynthesis